MRIGEARGYAIEDRFIHQWSMGQGRGIFTGHESEHREAHC